MFAKRDDTGRENKDLKAIEHENDEDTIRHYCIIVGWDQFSVWTIQPNRGIIPPSPTTTAAAPSPLRCQEPLPPPPAGQQPRFADSKLRSLIPLNSSLLPHQHEPVKWITKSATIATALIAPLHRIPAALAAGRKRQATGTAHA